MEIRFNLNDWSEIQIPPVHSLDPRKRHLPPDVVFLFIDKAGEISCRYHATVRGVHREDNVTYMWKSYEADLFCVLFHNHLQSMASVANEFPVVED
jgi:hypothetical protein